MREKTGGSMQTPRGRVRSALRKLWLYSRERNQAIQEANYSCAKCGIKQSKAKDNIVKVEVHHKEGIGNWEKVIDIIFEELLCSVDKLEVLCKECHGIQHK